MSSSSSIVLGRPLLISHLLADGASGLFPQAVIRFQDGSIVATLDLTEVASTGRYVNFTFTPTLAGVYTSHVIVYTDAGHTTKALNYTEDADTFVVEHGVNAAETTAVAGSTTTEIRTGLTQADDFFNNMVVIIVNAAGVVARNVDDYANTNGAITIIALPFTPAINDPVFILRRTGSISTADDHIAIETTAVAGSTTEEIRTGLTQADDFFNNMQVVIENAAGIVARNIEKFENTNGAIFVTALPFTPSPGDVVTILRRTSERIRDRFDPTGLFK